MKRVRMDYFKPFILSLFILITGCTSSEIRKDVSLINQAESLLQSDPQQAYALLDSVKFPEDLSDKELIKWCLFSGKLTDSIHTQLPWSYYLERSWEYSHKKKLPECATIGLYLGRSYMEENEMEKALKIYLQALDIALQEENYNLAGYICSYSSDVYKFQFDYLLAKDKYLQAAAYFKQAGNKRSEGLALTAVGKMYYYSDSVDLGLKYIKHADSLICILGDSSDISYTANFLGNVYALKKEYELSESYFFKSLDFGDEDNAHNYLALANLYLAMNRLEDALLYLKKANKPSSNKYIKTDLLYHYYLYYDRIGNYKRALSYLEEYVDTTESVTERRNKSNVNQIENNYKQAQLLLENIFLKVDKERIKKYTSWIILLFVIVLTYFRISSSKKIYRQRLEIERKNVSLSDLQKRLIDSKIALEYSLTELKIKQQTLDMVADYQNKIKDINTLIQQIKSQRLIFFKEATITQKVIRLSNKIVPNKTGKLLTEQDWKEIIDLLNFSYPNVVKKSFEINLTKTERELCYLSLFDLGASGEAVVMGCSVDAINKCRQRIRKKFSVPSREITLYQFLVDLKE